MLTGRWLQDLVDTIAEHIPADRQAAWGVPDMSSNIFKAASSSLCGLYREAPTIAVTETRDNQSAGLVGSEGLINRAGLWPLMQRVQFFTIGMRECFLRVDITDDGKDLLYRIVTPDFVDAESSAGDPSRPNQIKEMRPDMMRTLKNMSGRLICWTSPIQIIRDMKFLPSRKMERLTKMSLKNI